MRKLALITGASSGIGAQFARAYAARGHDLAITARRKDRLDELAKQISDDHSVSVQTIAADLADPAAPKQVLDAVASDGRHVDVMINNAGYSLPDRFEQTDWKAQADFMQVLMTAPAEFCHRVLPDMRARGYGRVINVASVAGMLPGVAGHSLYCAAKSFIIKMSQSLNLEAGSGVHVSVICPGLTRTEFQTVARIDKRLSWTPDFMWQKPESVVERAIRAVEANETVAVPGLLNQSGAVLGKLLPDEWTLMVLRRQPDFLAPDQAH